MPSLYRKYRPQTFAEVVGQNHIKVTLLSELSSGKLAHAYLFAGPRGVGKTTMARLMAKAVNCRQPKDGEPCNACDACTVIQSGRALDIVEIDAASNTGVDHVRDHIIDNARFSPSQFAYKVFIIDEVHMLSLSAFNALLKTLEEPPAHALFILATTEVHKIPETILSRCQRFDFRQLRFDDLVARLKNLVTLENANVEDPVLEAIARYARGSARDAENLLGQALTIGSSPITLDDVGLILPRSDLHLVFALFETLLRKDAAGAVQLVNKLVQEGIHLSQFVQDAIEFFRKALLIKVSSQLDMFSSLELPKDDEKRLLELLESTTAEDLQRMITVFFDYEGELKMSMLPQLPLEMAVLELTLPRQGVTYALPPTPPTPVAPNDAGSVPQFTTTKVADAPKPSPKNEAAKTEPDEPKPRPKQAPLVSLTIEDIRGRWTEVITRLKESQSLKLTLNVAQPVEVQGSTVVIGVGYPFHRERLEVPRHREMLEAVLLDVLGAAVTVKAVVLDTPPPVPNFEREANVEEVEVRAVPVAEPTAKAPGDDRWNSIVEMFSGKPS